eukprot:m.958248 g.958248  ORF g.958248 m.958248 type:complete len:752 (+) comp23879_c0_seq13:259-2514(+)
MFVARSCRLCHRMRQGSGALRSFLLQKSSRTNVGYHTYKISLCGNLSWEKETTPLLHKFRRQVPPIMSLSYCRTRLQCKKGNTIGDSTASVTVTESINPILSNRKDELNGGGYFDQMGEDPLASPGTLHNKIGDESQAFGNEVAKPSKRIPSKDELQRLASLAAGEGKSIAVAVGLLLTSSAVTMSVPMGMGHIIDLVSANATGDGALGAGGGLLVTMGGLSAVFALGAAANMGRIYLIQRTGARIVKRLRDQLFRHLCFLDLAFFDETKTGELTNRLSADTLEIGKALADNVSNGLRSATQAVVGVSLMVYLSPKLATVFLLVIPPIGLVGVYFGRTIQRLSRETQNALADATSRAEETFSNMYSIKAFNQELFMAEKYREKVDRSYELQMQETVARASFFGFAGLMGNLGLISVLGYGGTLTATEGLTVGDLSAFLLYTAYVGASVSGLASFHAELMKGVGASSRIFGLLDRTQALGVAEARNIIIPPEEFQGKISFRDVHFSYPTRPTPILQGFSMDVPAGGVQAVVGGSGSGKSTLIALLLRLYECDRGAVFIDDVYDVRDLDPYWFRQQVAVVEQNPVLLSGTIADNIRFGAPDASVDDVRAAADQAFATQFINDFPNGFDTVVGERGVMLSGGQQQRIAIARAILKNPRILLLDEATSALDATSEHYVQAALARLMQGRTTIQITHRLSSIAKDTQVAVIGDGQLVREYLCCRLYEEDVAMWSHCQRRPLHSCSSYCIGVGARQL